MSAVSSAPRANATTLEVTAETIRSRDGYDVRVTVRLPVRLHDSPIDRAAFAKAVGDGRTVDGGAERIVKLIDEPVQKALAATADGDAAELLASAVRFAEAAASAARGPLFAAGLMLDGDVTATVDAPALRQRQAEQAAAAASKAAADRADDLLRRFEDIRRANPDVPPGRLLMALPPEDRRDALLKLFEAAGTKEPGRLMLAAGVRLFEVESDGLRDIGDLGELGPIRRLRRDVLGDRVVLLVGSRDGVSIASADVPVTAHHYSSSLPAHSSLGFNDAAVVSDWGPTLLVATHGERGVEAWGERESSSETWPQDDLRQYPAFESNALPPIPRAVTGYADGEVAVAIGNLIFAWDGRHSSVADMPADLEVAPVLALMRSPHNSQRPILAVMSDGNLASLTADDGRLKGTAATPVDLPLTAACAVPWLGDVRVAACVEDGPVVVAGPDDDVRVEYRSEHKGFAAVAASGGRLAAVTGDRQRVVVWNLHEPERPVLDLYALGDTRSRVADVAFL